MRKERRQKGDVFRPPKWCKKDCLFRDPEAEFMPACQYGGKLKFKLSKGTDGIDKVEECLSYRRKKMI